MMAENILRSFFWMFNIASQMTKWSSFVIEEKKGL